MINILAYSTEASLSKDTENMLQAEWGFTQDLTDCDKIIKHRGIIDALYESENPALLLLYSLFTAIQLFDIA